MCQLELDQSVGHLASTLPGASRVLHRHGIDSCCGGGATLVDACTAAGVEVATAVAEIKAEGARTEGFERVDEQTAPEVAARLLERFHEPHRSEPPRLFETAGTVERLHADRAT